MQRPVPRHRLLADRLQHGHADAAAGDRGLHLASGLNRRVRPRSPARAEVLVRGPRGRHDLGVPAPAAGEPDRLSRRRGHPVTIEYTALYDADYERKVRMALPTRRQRQPRAERPRRLSGRVVCARERRSDPARARPGRQTARTAGRLPPQRGGRPPRRDRAARDPVSRACADAEELAVDHLHIVRGDRRIEGGAAVANATSSARGSVPLWTGLLDPTPPDWDKAPTGDWELALSSEPTTREALRSGAIADLALVLSYHAALPRGPEDGATVQVG